MSLDTWDGPIYVSGFVTWNDVVLELDTMFHSEFLLVIQK